MRTPAFLLAAMLSTAVPGPLLGAEPSTPLALHPDNPHYFLFRGKPTILITSGEHYGALLNPDFDFRKYFRTLEADGLNLTRVFSGAYVEPVGAFNITSNTLAPAPGRFLAPWARSTSPGYANGGNKFDLTRWDDAYFARLRDLVQEAWRRGVVVEMNLFCPFYEEKQWQISPMNASNNVNGIGTVARTNVYTLDRHGGLLPVQEALTSKIVTELNTFDNVYYEICNEPYFGGVTLAWQHRIAEVIVATEKGLPRRHLISRNVANGRERVTDPHPMISILNFHYASPPDTVAMNYGLGKVIGDNETGFRGTNDRPYRIEAWQFILAGGGLFNHLDYSFVAGSEDGTFVYPPTQPGGGNPGFRRQLRYLRDFLGRFDFLRMKPDSALVAGLPPKGISVQALVEPGKAVALHLARDRDKDGKLVAAPGPVEFRLNLPGGKYAVEWLNTVTGKVDSAPTLDHGGGEVRLLTPDFEDDVALRVAR